MYLKFNEISTLNRNSTTTMILTSLFYDSHCISLLSYTGLFKMTVGVQLSSDNSAPNSGNNHHLTIPFDGGMYRLKRQGACVSRN